MKNCRPVKLLQRIVQPFQRFVCNEMKRTTALLLNQQDFDLPRIGEEANVKCEVDRKLQGKLVSENSFQRFSDRVAVGLLTVDLEMRETVDQMIQTLHSLRFDTSTSLGIWQTPVFVNDAAQTEQQGKHVIPVCPFQRRTLHSQQDSQHLIQRHVSV